MRVWGQEVRKRSESVGTRGKEERAGREVTVWGQKDRMSSDSVGTRGQDEK